MTDDRLFSLGPVDRPVGDADHQALGPIDAEVRSGPVTARPSVVRRWWVAGALIGVWAWSVLWFARIGFNPTDDGLILGQAARILNGQIPHADFATPRPVGSALLHMVDFALPTPLLLTSRALVLAELLVIAVATTRLISDRRVRDWGLALTSLAIVAFFVNAHTFPLMSWHTIDGLFVTSVALVTLDGALRRGSLPLLLAGSLLAGFAPLTKQSFVAAPILALGWLAWRRWTVQETTSRVPRWWLAASAGAAAVPGLAYLIWASQPSGPRLVLEQLLGAGSVNASILPWLTASGRVAAIVTVTSVVSIVVWTTGGAQTWYPRRAGRVGLLVIAAVLMVASAAIVVDGRLSLGGTWGQQLWWIAAAATLIRSAIRRRPDAGGITVLTMAWMASLSWGYAVPNLLAGSLLALVLLRSSQIIGEALGQPRTDQSRTFVPLAAGCLAAFVVIAAIPIRLDHVYRDVPAHAQTSSLGRVASSTRGVTSNESTVVFMEQIRDCLARYPAKYLAVLPDAPGAPALLGRENPLPLDWWYPPEIPEDREWLVAQLQEVDARSDYLVLFQTVDAASLAVAPVPSPASNTSALFDYPNGMVSNVFEELSGSVVTCGSFVGRYEPAVSP